MGELHLQTPGIFFFCLGLVGSCQSEDREVKYDQIYLESSGMWEKQLMLCWFKCVYDFEIIVVIVYLSQ